MNNDTYKRLWDSSRSLFSESSPINYFPVVGKDYFKAPVRILVLGHSHYSKPENRARDDVYHESTFESVIGEYMQRRWQRNFSSFHEVARWDKFEKTDEEKAFEKQMQETDPKYRIPGFWKDYRKMGNLICNRPERDNNCDYVWDNLAFYNYFQKTVGAAPRNYDYLKADHANFIKDAEQAFFGLVRDKYARKPESILGILKPHIVIVWGDIVCKELPKADGSVNEEIKKLNCFAYKEFPDTIFFKSYHPAYRNWNKYVGEIHQRFSGLQKFYPIAKIIDTHIPTTKVVQSLNEAMQPYLSCYESFFSETSFTCRLFEIVDGMAKESASKSMFLEAAYKSNDCVEIRFYTQDFQAATASSILSSSEFMASESVLNTEFEGRFTLDTLPINSPKQAIVAKLRDYMQKMWSWREHHRT